MLPGKPSEMNLVKIFNGFMEIEHLLSRNMPEMNGKLLDVLNISAAGSFHFQEHLMWMQY